jgi:hypothetical protein
MNKRELQVENDALREALVEAYNSIEAALNALDSDEDEMNDDEDEDGDDDDDQ